IGESRYRVHSLVRLHGRQNAIAMGQNGARLPNGIVDLDRHIHEFRRETTFEWFRVARQILAGNTDDVERALRDAHVSDFKYDDAFGREVLAMVDNLAVETAKFLEGLAAEGDENDAIEHSQTVVPVLRRLGHGSMALQLVKEVLRL